MESNLSLAQLVERQQDQKLYAAIKRLPDGEFCPSSNQKRELQEQRNFWGHVGLRIDYLQSLQLGLKLDSSQDPCQNPAIAPIQAEYLRVFTDYYFRILQLLIADPTNPVTGFSIVEKWAISRGREFSFRSPRELFIQICRDQANSGWQINLEGNPSKEELKRAIRIKKKLFKGSLEIAQTTELLESWAEEDWSLAWISAIYSVRTQKPLREYWHKLDQAHDCLVEFICRSPAKHAKQGAKLILPGRNRGDRQIDPETKQILFYEQVKFCKQD